MSRPSRTVALAGASVLLVVLGPAAVAGASAPPGAAPRAAAHLARNPAPAPSGGSMPGMDDGSMPGMDDGSMPGMDHGSMPGMDHGSATPSPAAGTGAAGGGHDDMAGMPGMADSHDEAAPASRPLAWVIGTFVAVNGLMMAAAAVLRRRRPARPATRRPRAAAA